MDIFKKQKKSELLVEEINDDISKLISENWLITLGKMLFNPSKAIPRYMLMKSGEKLVDELTKKEDELDLDKATSDIESLQKEIEELKKLLAKVEMEKDKKLPFKKIIIHFNHKVELNVESLKSPEFNRNLVGTMYFKVVGYNEKVGYIDLKTKSFPETMIIRLHFDKLETYREQNGDANLIYSRYGKPELKPVPGEEKASTYKIIEMS